jgi:Zn-dependent protease with chaperone function
MKINFAIQNLVSSIKISFLTFLGLALILNSAIAQNGGPTIPDETEEEMQREAKTPKSVEVFLERARKGHETNSGMASFYKLMQDEYIRDAYHEIQSENLSSPSDRIIKELYQSHPVFQSIVTKISEIQNAYLDDVITNFEISMEDAGADLTKLQKKLNEIVVKVLINGGFSDKAIKNRKIYIVNGPMNAYTVSGNKDKVIVVVNRELLENMTTQEIQAVIEHEIGHILSKHTLYGIANSVMLQWVFENMVSRIPGKGMIVGMSDGKGGSEVLFGDEIKVLRSQLTAPLHEHCNIAGCDRPFDWIAQHNPTSAAGIKKTFSDADFRINEMMVELNNQSARTMYVPAKIFLEKISEALKYSDGDPRLEAYFKGVLQNFDDAYVKKLNFMQFNLAVGPTMTTFTRMSEMTADMYAASNIVNVIVASAFAKLIGSQYNDSSQKRQRDEAIKNNNELRNKVLAAYYRKAEEFKKRVDPADQFRFNDSSHPQLALRIFNVLNIPKDPTIKFANPFMRLLLLQSSMQMNSILLSDTKKSETRKFIADGTLNTKEAKDRLSQLAIQKNLADQKSAVVTKEIERLILKQMGSHVQQPRIQNVLQFYLNLKTEVVENNLASISKLTNLQKNPKVPKDHPYVLALKNQLRTFANLEFVIDQALERYQALVGSQLRSKVAFPSERHSEAEREIELLEKNNLRSNLLSFYFQLFAKGKKTENLNELEQIKVLATMNKFGVIPEHRLPVEDVKSDPKSNSSQTEKSNPFGLPSSPNRATYRCEHAFSI